MISEYVKLGDLPNKKLYMLDTFCGIPERYRDEPTAGVFEEFYGDSYEQVCETFAGIENAIVVRGVIPDTLHEVKAESICFLSIDLNVAGPSVAAVEYFWPKMSLGAPIVFDDYNFRFFVNQKIALDKFATRVGATILALPTGQGLLIKA